MTMTKWEVYARLAMIQTNNREKCVETLSSLLNISTWEAERLIDQVNFKKKVLTNRPSCDIINTEIEKRRFSK